MLSSASFCQPKDKDQKQRTKQKKNKKTSFMHMRELITGMEKQKTETDGKQHQN